MILRKGTVIVKITQETSEIYKFIYIFFIYSKSLSKKALHQTQEEREADLTWGKKAHSRENR